MSNHTHETVPTEFVEAEGIRYAYRRFGKAGTVPLLFLGYFNSNMDAWDPAVTNSLAADHEVILFDNAGVGASGGETPYTIVDMMSQCVAFCRALGLKAIHVVGFSLGGIIVQQLALDHPDLVQRLILLGTAPRGGEGLTFTELSAEEQADPVAFLLGAFFTPSDASQAAGRKYMKRLESRTKDRDLPVSRNSAVAQLAAIREWGTIPASGRYATLQKIINPTLNRSWQQRRCGWADQCTHSCRAPTECSANRVLRFESWHPVSTCRDIPATCEPVLERGEFSVSWLGFSLG
jgi:pimeloyl-ACP methyl ester carboxylesterase